MITIELMEIIFETPWVTPEQLESAAVLYARQEYERNLPKRKLLEAIERDGDVMPTIWSQIARTI